MGAPWPHLSHGLRLASGIPAAALSSLPYHIAAETPCCPWRARHHQPFRAEWHGSDIGKPPRPACGQGAPLAARQVLARCGTLGSGRDPGHRTAAHAGSHRGGTGGTTDRLVGACGARGHGGVAEVCPRSYPLELGPSRAEVPARIPSLQTFRPRLRLSVSRRSSRNERERKRPDRPLSPLMKVVSWQNPKRTSRQWTHPATPRHLSESESKPHSGNWGLEVHRLLDCGREGPFWASRDRARVVRGDRARNRCCR